MEDFLKTRAEVVGGRIFIDSRINTDDREEAEKLRPWWLAASAAYIIKYEHGYGVILVRRSDSTDFAEKWALLPSGGSSRIEEFLQPGLLLEREMREELILYNDGVRRDPIHSSFLLTKNRFEIYDHGTSQWYWDKGEIFFTEQQVFLMRAYLSTFDLKNITIKDGEMRGDEELDRLVAVFDLDNDFDGLELPIAMFKSGKREIPSPIDLTGYQTPTIVWLREYKDKIGELIENLDHGF